MTYDERLITNSFESYRNYLYKNYSFALSKSYVRLLQWINPEAQFEGREGDIIFNGHIIKNYKPYFVPLILANENGFIFHSLSCGIKPTLEKCTSSKDFFLSQVCSRLLYLILLPTSILVRLIDFVIGILAAIFSLITLGYFTSCNNLAFRGLQVFGLITDIFTCVCKFIWPTAGLKIKESVTQAEIEPLQSDSIKTE